MSQFIAETCISNEHLLFGAQYKQSLSDKDEQMHRSPHSEL